MICQYFVIICSQFIPSAVFSGDSPSCGSRTSPESLAAFRRGRPGCEQFSVVNIFWYCCVFCFCTKERYIFYNEQSVKFKQRSNSHASCMIFNLGNGRLYLNFSAGVAPRQVQCSLKIQHFPLSVDNDTFHFNSILIEISQRFNITFFLLCILPFLLLSSMMCHQLRLLRDHPRHFWRSRKNRFRHVMNTLHDCVKDRSFF